jgi:hypothetical protein
VADIAMTLLPVAARKGGGWFGARVRAVALVSPLVVFLMAVFVLPDRRHAVPRRR